MRCCSQPATSAESEGERERARDLKLMTRFMKLMSHCGCNDYANFIHLFSSLEVRSKTNLEIYMMIVLLGSSEISLVSTKPFNIPTKWTAHRLFAFLTKPSPSLHRAASAKRFIRTTCVWMRKRNSVELLTSSQTHDETEALWIMCEYSVNVLYTKHKVCE